MKYALFGVAATLIIAFAVIFFQTQNSADPLAKYGLDQLSITQLVAELENRVDEPDTLKANIDGSNLNMIASGESINIALPTDLFYLSFAPYINSTHPCGIHNLITCRGELKLQTFHVVVIDNFGNVLADQDMTSYANGFAGIWLPSETTGTITVTYLDLSASSSISTFSGDFTCLTTLELLP